jgi:hypothetical protein
LLVGRLCGFPQRFRDDLRKGEKLRLDGTGTAWGLFVHNVTAVQG